MRTIQTLRKLRKLRKYCVISCVVAAGCAGLAAHAGADDQPTGQKPVVALDKLLTIPHSVRIDVDRRGGATRAEWRERFENAQNAVIEEKKNLEESLAKMGDLARSGGNWKVAAPGQQAVADDTSPMNYGLKQQVRRDREGVVRAERDLVDLRVQANLAGVPDEWWMDQ